MICGNCKKECKPTCLDNSFTHEFGVFIDKSIVSDCCSSEIYEEICYNCNGEGSINICENCEENCTGCAFRNDFIKECDVCNGKGVIDRKEFII
jgi:hypothetical protein